MKGRHAFVVGALILMAFLGAWKLGLFGLHDRAQLVVFIQRIRALRGAKIIFVALYAAASAIGVPASPLTLAGGAIFGTAWGVALNWLGAMAGALLAFATVRVLRTSLPLSLLRRTGDQFPAISDAPRALFRLRVIPVVPFALLNVGAALVRMGWWPYAVATGLGIVPVIVVYTTFAASLVSGVSGAGGRALATAMIAGVALVALSFARPGIIGRSRSGRVARSELRHARES
jgi:uncharacterized membrane protein YdjX (TVP38/TMEM64 family)